MTNDERDELYSLQEEVERFGTTALTAQEFDRYIDLLKLERAELTS